MSAFGNIRLHYKRYVTAFNLYLNRTALPWPCLEGGMQRHVYMRVWCTYNHVSLVLTITLRATGTLVTYLNLTPNNEPNDYLKSANLTL